MTAGADSDSRPCTCCGQSDWAEAGSYSVAWPARRPGEPETLTYNLIRCRACEHVMANPMLSESDLNAYYGTAFWSAHGIVARPTYRDWKSAVTANSSLWERYKRAERQIDFVEASGKLPSSARVIDLGSGVSPFLYWCKERGLSNLSALEPSSDVCAFLADQGVTTYSEVLESFVERQDAPLYDLILISHTVEHLIDPSNILVKLGKLLAPGGRIMIDVPNQDHLRPFHQGLHLQFFSENSLTTLMRHCGYRLLAAQADNHNWLERIFLSSLYAVYRQLYRGDGGVKASGKIELLHRFGWRPVKTLLGLRLNIFVSSADLRIVATPVQ